jgi:hypothetical protein
MSKILSREEILGAKDSVMELVPVPEWGGEVYVRGLTGAERDRYEATILRQKGKRREVVLEDLRAKLAVVAICTEQGDQVFTQADIAALSRKSAAALQRVFTVASRLSGLSDEDVESLVKESEEDLKNDQSAASPSA